MIPVIIAEVAEVAGASEGVVKALEALASAARSAVEGLASLLGTTTSEAEKAARAAARLGMDVHAFEELSTAAELAGVSTSSLEEGLEVLVRTNLDVKAGSSDAAKLFKELGVDAKEAEPLFLDVAEALARIPAGPERARLAMKAFGESAGRELLPFLERGREGIGGLRREADLFGAALEKGGTEASRGFGAATRELGVALDGLGESIAVPMLKALTPIVEGLAVAVGVATNGVKAFLAVAGVLWDVLVGVGDAIGSALVASIGSALGVLGGLGVALRAIGNAATVVWKVFKALAGAVRAVLEVGIQEALAKAGKWVDRLGGWLLGGKGGGESAAIAAPATVGAPNVASTVNAPADVRITINQSPGQSGEDVASAFERAFDDHWGRRMAEAHAPGVR